MQNGTILDSNYLPDRDNIYSILIKYLDNPKMIKVKDENGMSTYMTKCSCLLMNVCRYIVATFKSDSHPVGNIMYLSDFNWETLQFRILKGKYENVVVHGYNAKNEHPYNLKLELYDRNDKITSYKCEALPLMKIHLFHKKPDNIYEFPTTGTIASAIETYSTIISF